MPPEPEDYRHFKEPNLRVPTADRQHYVPRLYLGNFIGEGGIAVNDLQTGRCFTTSVGNVAVESGFYNLQAEELTVSTEDWLADVEAAAAPILRRLVTDPGSLLALSDEEQNHFARYMAAQRFRVPAFRDFERATRSHLLQQLKPMARKFLERKLPAARVRKVWREWEKMPDEWWLQEDAPFQDADACAYMLEEVQGWANLLLAMSWRLGYADPSLVLYTSDNPMSAYLPPVRPWPSGGAMWEHVYIFPLSPRLLMRIDPLPYETELQPRGPRWSEDFSSWETSFARHVVTADATRFIYGTTCPVPRHCALSCLRRINAARLYDAIRLQGYDPRPPTLPRLPSEGEEA
jgi:hypothetical protein